MSEKKVQKQVKFTVSPEAEASFKLWVAREGLPTKVFYAMWRAYLDLLPPQRARLKDQMPKGSEFVPAWATVDALQEVFEAEQSVTPRGAKSSSQIGGGRQKRRGDSEDRKSA